MIFALGTFSSKVLVFVMMPFYTSILSSAQYGLMDLLVQTCNLLLPLATVGINNAVIRFGLEESRDKRCVFSAGLCTILAGWSFLLLCGTWLEEIPFLNGYTLLIFAYVLASGMHALCNQFSRALGHLRLYAVDGVLRTLTTVLLNILFLSVFSWGVEGYLLASILSDTLSVLFLTGMSQLWRYWKPSSLKYTVWKEMLGYAAPLIPTTVCTWIINISDRYMISYLLGLDANAPYSAANKIPTVLIIVANIFTESWQISAIEQRKEMGRTRFFSHVGEVYLAIACVTGSVLILSARITMKILTPNPAYDMAWKYVPILVMATTFACLSSFLNSIYVVEKKSMATFVTTALSAMMNIGLNVLFIPRLGVIGAGIATLSSYLFLFVMRLWHTRKYIALQWDGEKLVLGLLLLGLQAVIMSTSAPYYPIWQVVLLICIGQLHKNSMIKAVGQFFKKRDFPIS